MKRYPSADKRYELLTAIAIKMIAKYAKVFNIKDIVISIRPLKPRLVASTGTWLGFRFISVNIEYAVKLGLTPYMLKGIIFHEFGHVVCPNKNLSKIESEYFAEKTGLNWYKKYYPEEAAKYITMMKKALKGKGFSKKHARAYKLAFSKIKDYND